MSLVLCIYCGDVMSRLFMHILKISHYFSFMLDSIFGLMGKGFDFWFICLCDCLSGRSALLIDTFEEGREG